MFDILDCTLRDGGYYTNWDFDRGLVQQYLQSMAKIPISYVELGYRCPMKEGYSGEYYHLPRKTIERARAIVPNGPAFALMLDAKNISPEQVPPLLDDCRDLVKLVRLAVDPAKLDHGLALARTVHDSGFEVGLNLMYLSQHWQDRELFEALRAKGGFIDYIRQSIGIRWRSA